jgi:hypothetical protein
MRVSGTLVVRGLTEHSSTNGGRTLSTNSRPGRTEGRGRFVYHQGQLKKRVVNVPKKPMNVQVFECYDENSSPSRKYNEGSEYISNLFLTVPSLPVLVRPLEPAPRYNDTDKFIRHEELKELDKRKHTLNRNFTTVTTILWGQCSDDMMAKLKEYNDTLDELHFGSFRGHCYFVESRQSQAPIQKIYNWLQSKRMEKI